MNMLERMNTTIEYIEEHLLEELHMPTIASVAGTSESEIQKTFFCANRCFHRRVHTKKAVDFGGV